MLVLKDSITVYVTADDSDVRDAWVEHFAHVLGAATCITGVGTWEGIIEPVVKVEHFCDDSAATFVRILFSLVNYKNDAKQDAVSVQFSAGPLVVFDTVRELFDYADKIR